METDKLLIIGTKRCNFHKLETLKRLKRASNFLRMKQKSEPEKAERITSDKEERIGVGWKNKNVLKVVKPKLPDQFLKIEKAQSPKSYLRF